MALVRLDSLGYGAEFTLQADIPGTWIRAGVVYMIYQEPNTFVNAAMHKARPPWPPQLWAPSDTLVNYPAPGGYMLEESLDYWAGQGYLGANAEKIAKWVRENKARPTQAQIDVIIGSVLATPPEQLEGYWVARGYSLTAALKLTTWCKANKVTPTQAQINEILGIAVTPTPTPTPTIDLRKPWQTLTAAEQESEANRLSAKNGLTRLTGALGNVQMTQLFPALRMQELFDVATPEEKAEGLSGAIAIVIAATGLGALLTASGALVGAAAIKTISTTAVAEITSKSWLDAMRASIKANPLMTFFAATEIPNLIQMTQFAQNQIAQSTGQTLPQIQAQLTTLENAIKNAGYDFDAAIKAKNTAEAATILATMEGVLAQYKAAIETNKSWLTNVGTLANANAIYDLYSSTTASLKAQLPAAPAVLEAALTETMDVQITKVTDGDTVEATTSGIPSTTFPVRILGLNSPDKDLTVVWVKSKIDGAETRYTLASADYKAANTYAVANLQRAYVTLLIDPANKVDKYGRALASIKYDVGSGNYAIDMVKMGLAVAYLEGTNKYVDAAAFKAAQAAAMSVNAGLWKTVRAQYMGKLKISSSPTNAKLYIDGTYTNHLTPETLTLGEDEYEVKVAKTGYEPLVKYLTVKRGETVEDLFELQKTALGAPGVPSTVTGPTPVGFSISIDSAPSNAKLSVDNIYTHHLTPSNEKELRDVMSLLAPGTHKISASRSGMYAEVIVQIVAGENAPIVLTLA